MLLVTTLYSYVAIKQNLYNLYSYVCICSYMGITEFISNNGWSQDIFWPNQVSVQSNQIWPDKFTIATLATMIEFAKNNECPDNFSPYHKYLN